MKTIKRLWDRLGSTGKILVSCFAFFLMVKATGNK